MRSTEFLFDRRGTLASLLARAEGCELALSCTDGLKEGDWLLVTIRVPKDTTCLPARVITREGSDSTLGLEFTEHDWEYLLDFAAPDTVDPDDRESRQTPPCTVCPPSDTNVLIVHDDATVADLIARMLGKSGFIATWVSTPEEALDTLRARRVDLVLSDWMPRGMAGHEFCDRLANQCATCAASRPPIVFLACPSARGDRTAALRAGASDFVVLPFRWHELDARLLSLLHRTG